MHSALNQYLTVCVIVFFLFELYISFSFFFPFFFKLIEVLLLISVLNILIFYKYLLLGHKKVIVVSNAYTRT